MTNKRLNTLYKTHKEDALFGRYIHAETIALLLDKHRNHFEIKVIGQSVLKEDIHSITIGSGKKKILMWSQMHGNESTTTKAIFDLLNFFAYDIEAEPILKTCKLIIIPILNPDGAKAYTRLNANKIDLNRDAKALTQPESVILRNLFYDFKPNYCFNLHGQRTIFSAGSTNNPATVSFLSPAQDKNCTITDNRKIAMSLISKMNTMLQQEIPNQVGIYDDAFNINCVGDTFQGFNVPTVLFEAGHFVNDYNREEVRRLVFQSYMTALAAITNDEVNLLNTNDYLEIPKNDKLFYDIIIKNALINTEVLDVAIQYQEKLCDNVIKFVPKIEKIQKLDNFYAHNYVNANKQGVLSDKKEQLKVGNEIDFVIVNNEKLSLKFN